MGDVRSKIKLIKEARLAPEQLLFLKFVKYMSHRPDGDVKNREEWFAGYTDHIFTHDTTHVTVWTNQPKWKSFEREVYNICGTNKLTVAFLESQIKDFFGCETVEFFFNKKMEDDRREWNSTWLESYSAFENK